MDYIVTDYSEEHLSSIYTLMLMVFTVNDPNTI